MRLIADVVKTYTILINFRKKVAVVAQFDLVTIQNNPLDRFVLLQLAQGIIASGVNTY